MFFVKNTIDLFTMNYNNEDIPIKINNSSEEIKLNQKKSEINTKINNQYQREMSIFEKFISKTFKIMTNFLQLIGPLFTYTISLFLLYTYISIIKSIVPEYKNQNKILISKLISISTLIELFYILFNFFLATLIKPGSIIDIINSKYYKKNNPYFSKDLILPQMTFRINQNKKKKNWKKCRYCQIIKPLRTHHCAICNNCIFKMDHHCPWINNCVGQNNQRYFLLFLTHTFIYDIIIISSIIPLLLKGYFRKMENQLKFVIILSIASFIILLFFNSWNWFLALNGKTTLEFWGEKSGFINEKISPVSYDFGNWKKNLFYVFGCDNLFFIIFIPNIKKLPFSGLEWSKFVDDNFYVEGIDNFNNESDLDIEININI